MLLIETLSTPACWFPECNVF